MTFDELMCAVLAILPDAQLGEDNDGQIVVYTNKKQEGDNVVDMDLPPKVIASVCNCAQCEAYRQ